MAGMAGSVAAPTKIPTIPNAKAPGWPENHGATRLSLWNKESDEVEGVVVVINAASGKKGNTEHYRHSFAPKMRGFIWLPISL